MFGRPVSENRSTDRPSDRHIDRRGPSQHDTGDGQRDSTNSHKCIDERRDRERGRGREVKIKRARGSERRGSREGARERGRERGRGERERGEGKYREQRIVGTGEWP